MIAAGAAIMAIGTVNQTLGFEEPVQFSGSFSERIPNIGGTNSRFVCPDTALIFVHYRILVRRGDNDSIPCTPRLDFGDEFPLAVSSFK